MHLEGGDPHFDPLLHAPRAGEKIDEKKKRYLLPPSLPSRYTGINKHFNNLKLLLNCSIWAVYQEV